MSTASPAVSGSAKQKPNPFELYVKPWLTPYYLTIAGILGAATAAFTVLILLIILVSTNFNVLGWME